MGLVRWDSANSNIGNENGVAQTVMALYGSENLSAEERKHTTQSKNTSYSIFEGFNETQKRKAQTFALRNTLNNIKAQQKWLGNTWDTIKIGFSDKDSSENVENMISAFENCCGVTFEQALNALKGYAEGQKQVIDVTADVAGGIAAFGCYAYAMGGAVAAPVTGGASATQTAVGIAFAGTASAAARTFIKGTNLDNYTWEEQLKDIGRGYVDGVIAPMAAATEYATLKGLGKVGWSTAQSAAATMENQIVVGFGKSTTKTGLTSFANGLSEATATSFGNGGLGIYIDRESLAHATSAQLRELGGILFQNSTRQGIQQATTLGERWFIQEGMRTAARPLLGGAVSNPTIGGRILLNTVKGSSGGATYGGVKGGSDYMIDSFVDGTPWSLAEFGTRTGAGMAGGAVAGGTLAAGTTFIGEGVRAICTGSEQGRLPFTVTEDITFADVPTLKNGTLSYSQTPFGSLTVPSQKGVVTVKTQNGASVTVPVTDFSGASLTSPLARAAESSAGKFVTTFASGGILIDSTAGGSTETASIAPLAETTTTEAEVKFDKSKNNKLKFILEPILVEKVPFEKELEKFIGKFDELYYEKFPELCDILRTNPHATLTLLGKKPVSIIYADFLKNIKNINLPEYIDIIPSVRNNYFILNKKASIKTINDNLDFFVKRLNLPSDTSAKKVYEIIVKNISENHNFTKGKDDILGILLGFPKINSMIFKLEKDMYAEGNIPESLPRNIDLRADTENFKKCIINFLHSEKSPYNNMGYKFKNDLEKIIRNIKKIGAYRPNNEDYGFEFILFADEVDMLRLRNSEQEFFKLLKSINSRMKNPDYCSHELF